MLKTFCGTKRDPKGNNTPPVHQTGRVRHQGDWKAGSGMQIFFWGGVLPLKSSAVTHIPHFTFGLPRVRTCLVPTLIVSNSVNIRQCFLSQSKVYNQLIVKMKSVAPSCMTSRLDMDVPDACSGICMTASPARSESQSDSEEMQAWFTKLMQLVPETRADRQTDKTRLLEDVMDYINYLADIVSPKSGALCKVFPSSSGRRHSAEESEKGESCHSSSLSSSTSSSLDDLTLLPEPSE